MSITVADCLKLSCLKKSKVVSGHEGLSKIVNTLSVLEYADWKILKNNQLFKANEIVLSAFASIKDDVVAQCKTLEALHDSGDVALVLYYVGYMITELDQKVLDKSNELNFPVIVMPVGCIDIGYDEAITEITEAIYNDKYHETRFVNSMLERISQLPERQRTLSNIMQMLSSHLRCNLMVTDTFNKCICFVKRPMSADVTEELLLNYISNHDLRKENAFTEIELDEYNIYIIPFSQNHYSHLSLVAVDEAEQLSKESLLLAVELIEVSSNIWKYDLDTISLDRLIPTILNDNLEIAEQIAQEFQVKISSHNTMMVVEIDDNDLSLYERHFENDRLINIAKEFLSKNDVPPLVCAIGRQIVSLIAFPDDYDNTADFITEFRKLLFSKHDNLLFAYASNLSTVKNMRYFYSMYCNYFDNARIIYGNCETISLSQLEFCSECEYHISNKDTNNDDYLLPLRKIKDGDVLIDTLATYFLDANCEAKKTSEIMFLHKNTIRFRLNKIWMALKSDYTQMPEKYMIYRALALYRLTKEFRV